MRDTFFGVPIRYFGVYIGIPILRGIAIYIIKGSTYVDGFSWA